MSETTQVIGNAAAVGHAAGTDWRAVVRSIAEQLGERDDDSLGFLYVTDHLSEHLGDIASFLAGATGVLTWFGTVGIGICATATEYFDEPAAVALACRLGGTDILPFRSADEAIDGHKAQYHTAAGTFAVVQGDPRRAELAADIERLARGTEGFLVGGLSSSRRDYPHLAGRPADGALSGVHLVGASVATGLTQGCSPLGGVHEVTQAEDNLVIELDGRPAMDVFVEVLAETGVTDLASLSGALHVALPVTGSDTGDYLVRNLVGIDPDRRIMAVGERMAAGDALMFCRRDREAAERDLRRMLHDLKARAVRPVGGLYFSCLARGPSLFGEVGRELAIIAEELGDLPLVGFFGNGEISFDRLYAYTGVLTLFLDEEGGGR